MSLRMASPTKHPKTGTYRIRLAIPAHLRNTTATLYGVRAELIANLGTKDAKRAKSLADAAAGQLRGQLDTAERAFRGDTPQLTEHDVQALAGLFYRREVEAHGADPGPAINWDMTLEHLGDQQDPDPDSNGDVTLTQRDTDPARQLLAERGLPATLETVERLGMAVYRVRCEVAGLMLRRAGGDWRPDNTAARFPAAIPSATKSAAPPSPGLTFDALLAGWALDRGWQVDAKPIPRPLYDRKRTMERLADFLGHRDASRVAKADAVAWKEEMQGRGLHASTVRNDLSECSAVWAWGFRIGKLPAGENPFAGIAPPKAKKKGRDPRAFTDQEAATILMVARKETGWKRWLPWVLCLTGARVGEVVQSRKEDVATLDGVLVLRIHDRGVGRSIKNEDSRRDVPIHPALVAEGFPAYVAGLKAGSPLFPDIPVDKVFGTRAANASKRVGYWLRQDLAMTDDLISPNHSFRHWLIGAARRVAMPVEVRSAITGHSAKADESAGYGDGMKSFVTVLAEYLAKVPAPL